MTTIEKENKLNEILNDIQQNCIDLDEFTILYHPDDYEILYKNLSIGKSKDPIISNIKQAVYFITLSAEIEKSNIFQEKKTGSQVITLFR